jgi:hypothetical protein
MSASRTQMEISAPEQPSTMSDSRAKSSSVSVCGVSPCGVGLGMHVCGVS